MHCVDSCGKYWMLGVIMESVSNIKVEFRIPYIIINDITKKIDVNNV